MGNFADAKSRFDTWVRRTHRFTLPISRQFAASQPAAAAGFIDLIYAPDGFEASARQFIPRGIDEDFFEKPPAQLVYLPNQDPTLI